MALFPLIIFEINGGLHQFYCVGLLCNLCPMPIRFLKCVLALDRGSSSECWAFHNPFVLGPRSCFQCGPSNILRPPLRRSWHMSPHRYNHYFDNFKYQLNTIIFFYNVLLLNFITCHRENREGPKFMLILICGCKFQVLICKAKLHRFFFFFFFFSLWKSWCLLLMIVHYH